jgi:hypothetical protein
MLNEFEAGQMDKLKTVVDGYIHASEVQLRRIDELTAQARRAPPGAGNAHEWLHEIEAVRDRLVVELDKLRVAALRDEADAGQRAAEAKSVVGSVGTEFEKALAAIFDSRRRKPQSAKLERALQSAATTALDRRLRRGVPGTPWWRSQR